VIAVLGATGRVGRHVAAALADQPVEARALVRRPGAIGVPLPTVCADLTDPGSVRAALDGAERLFLVTPHGSDQDLLEAAAIMAAQEAGVKHVVKVSAGAAALGPSGTTAGCDGAPTDHVLQLTGQPPRAIETLLDEHHDLFAPTIRLARLLSRTTTAKD